MGALAARPIRIGVIGSGSPAAAAAGVAREAGREIARAGAVLVCGGLGGVMAAAAEGARAEGGTVLGILPGDDDRLAAPGVTIPVPTGLGEARNALVVRTAEAVIAVEGEWGTLSEAALCMKLGVPLVELGRRLPGEFPVERFGDPGEAVARALELARARRRAREA